MLKISQVNYIRDLHNSGPLMSGTIHSFAQISSDILAEVSLYKING